MNPEVKSIIPDGPAGGPKKPAGSLLWMLWAIPIGYGAIMIPLWLSQRNAPKHDSSELTVAMNNARQLGMALFEFESDYGHFPDASTAAEVKRRAGSHWKFEGATSNDLLKQLLAAGIVNSEDIFRVKISGPRADNRFENEADALAKGECGFAYLPGGDTSGSPQRPLAVAPLIPGTLKFDPESFDGKAIILRIDNSVQSCDIDAQGRVPYEGKDLFDPTQPYWKGKPPEVKWPK